MPDIYKLTDVFNEAYLPGVTFVPPHEFADMIGSLNTKGKHITLCGPSGCGKTTLAKKALEEAGIGIGEQYWISGREFSQFSSWEKMFASFLDCPENRNEIYEWLEACGILVIDDFHYLSESTRTDIGKILKLFHERNIRLFIIGIAATTNQLLDIDPELGIRNDPYEMKTQKDTFINEVIMAGEAALNISFDQSTKRDFIRASKGIPSAIQAICRIACLRNDVQQTLPDHIVVIAKMEDIKDGVLRIYRAKYLNKIIGLAKGKQQARSVHNTYFEIIKNLCLLDKSEIPTEELHERIVGVIPNKDERGRKNTSFYNCLNNLSSVIEDRGLSDAIYFDRTSKVISIEDPSFRLYLTLLDIEEVERAVHVRKTTFPWDVALSFAGEQRGLAERLKDILKQHDYTVFYDFDQEHLLWGQNLRQKLSEVYANEAEFMVVFLSKEYPEKEWPAFEFDVGKAARGKRTNEYLLPVIVDDVTVVGLSSDTGYIDLRKRSIEDLANTLMRKIEDSPLRSN